MAIQGTTNKQHKFRLETDGFDLAFVQSVETPEVEVEEIMWSAGDYDVKERGRVKTGDMVLNGIMLTGSFDELAFWFESGFSDAPTLGLKRTFRLFLLDDNGVPNKMWEARNCWVKKNSIGTLDKKTSDNVIPVVTLSVERFVVATLGVGA